MQNRFFFTALPVDLTEKVDPSDPLQGIKLVPGIHIPKDWKENLAKQKDEKYQEYLDAWLDETDPDRKVEIGKAANAYWAVRRKELGFLDEEDIKRLEEEKRKQKEEEEKQREIARQQHIQQVKKKIAKGISAKHMIPESPKETSTTARQEIIYDKAYQNCGPVPDLYCIHSEIMMAECPYTPKKDTD